MASLNSAEMLKQVKSIVERLIVHGPVNDTMSLVKSDKIDSLNIVQLIVELEKAFSISIKDEDMDGDNFETPIEITNLCERKLTAVAA